jgi:catechol 2,3-dioxygenase-like lactoylglutathione lyase family enzyme
MNEKTVVSATNSVAHLAAPNAAGVAMGHVHVKSRDMAAERKLWVDVLGGIPGQLGPMETARFAGGLVLYEPGEPGAGTAGSVLNHVGFAVRELKAVLAKVRAAGFRIESESDDAAFFFGPDEIRLEVMAKPELEAPTAYHHLHFAARSGAAFQEWYAKTLDAVSGTRAGFDTSDLPGINLTYTATPTGDIAGTRGRSVDHLGFEVRGLEAFVKKLQAQGVEFDVPYTNIAELGVALAYLYDPFGTYLELTEGLNRL